MQMCSPCNCVVLVIVFVVCSMNIALYFQYDSSKGQVYVYLSEKSELGIIL
jgi:hypothetical protein